MAVGGSYVPGKTIRVTYSIEPSAGGTSSLADIDCRQEDPDGNVTDLTFGVAEATTNEYYVDIPVTAPEGDWWVRFESSEPSVVDAFEIDYQVLHSEVGIAELPEVNVPIVVYDVREYGAIGNGTADDTAAIVAATNAAAGGTVYFPRGTYLVASPAISQIGIGVAGTTWLGESQSDSIVVFAPADVAAHNNVLLAADDLTFCNMTFRRASSASNTMFFIAASISRLTFRDCLLDGGDDLYPTGYTHGVKIPETGTCTSTRFERCTFSAFHFAILMNNTSTCVWTDAQFLNCNFTKWVGEGLLFNAPFGTIRDVVVDGCRFYEPSALGTIVNGLSMASVEHARVSNCWFDRDFPGIHMEDYCAYVSIVNNTFNESGGTAGPPIVVGDCHYVTIDGNTFRNAELNPYLTVILIVGNTVGTAVSGRPHLDATYAVTVSNNTINAGPNYGVQTVVCHQSVITGNTIIGDLAIDAATFAETGTNIYNGIATFRGSRGLQISGNIIKGFRVGIGPINANTRSNNTGTVMSNNAISECRFGILSNNTFGPAAFIGNTVNRCVWPFSVMPCGGGSDGTGTQPHAIVGNAFYANQYPAAFDNMVPVVANGTAVIGVGVTLAVQPLIADLPNNYPVTFAGGGVLTMTSTKVAGSTSITGNLVTANIAAAELGYLIGLPDQPYTAPFTVKQHSAYANVDSNREIYTATRASFYAAPPVAKAAAPGVAAGPDAAVINAITVALRNLGLVT